VGKVSSDEKVWEELSKNTLRGAMMSKGVSYAALAELLSVIGIEDNELNLRNKVSRGRFTAVFLMQCLHVLGAEWIHLPKDLGEATGKYGSQFLSKKIPVGQAPEKSPES
jgi:hypothetical protein